MTNASFDQTLARVDGLLSLHRKVHGQRGRPPQQVSDLLRGALVLTMAALDAVVLDSVLDAIPQLARETRLGANPAKWLKECTDPVAVIVDPNPTGALRTICSEKLSQQTFQTSSMIEGVLRDTLDCGPPWGLAAKRLSTNRSAWSAEDVKARLDELAQRRNRIAHNGDRVNERRTRPIRHDYVAAAVKVVGAVGHSTEKVISAHLAAASLWGA